jgi:hypothetical protein
VQIHLPGLHSYGLLMHNASPEDAGE